MNYWLVAATVLLVSMVPCIVVLARGKIMERVIALQGTQVLASLVLFLLSPGYGRDIYVDLSVTLAVLSFASGLVFVRFLERWL